jgi:hypothetical protein
VGTTLKAWSAESSTTNPCALDSRYDWIMVTPISLGIILLTTEGLKNFELSSEHFIAKVFSNRKDEMQLSSSVTE